MKKIEGGITAAKGFQAAGGAAGIKKQGVKDMALVYSEVPCVAAGTFTTNIVKAAPVKWDQEIVYNHPTAQAIVCNSGINRLDLYYLKVVKIYCGIVRAKKEVYILAPEIALIR